MDKQRKPSLESTFVYWLTSSKLEFRNLLVVLEKLAEERS